MVIALSAGVGCKPSAAPGPREQARKQPVKNPGKSTPTRENRRPTRPEQPPVSGETDFGRGETKELIQWLGHEDLAVRIEASERLLATGPEVIPELIAALDHENYHVRAGAVFSLGRFGPDAQPATARLRELAEKDKWEAVRDAARFALHDINQ